MGINNWTCRAMLRELGVTDEVVSTRIDDDGIEGEPVGVYTSQSGKFLIVTQPTADVLPKVTTVYIALI